MEKKIFILNSGFCFFCGMKNISADFWHLCPVKYWSLTHQTNLNWKPPDNKFTNCCLTKLCFFHISLANKDTSHQENVWKKVGGVAVKETELKSGLPGVYSWHHIYSTQCICSKIWTPCCKQVSANFTSNYSSWFNSQGHFALHACFFSEYNGAQSLSQTH